MRIINITVQNKRRIKRLSVKLQKTRTLKKYQAAGAILHQKIYFYSTLASEKLLFQQPPPRVREQVDLKPKQSRGKQRLSSLHTVKHTSSETKSTCKNLKFCKVTNASCMRRTHEADIENESVNYERIRLQPDQHEGHRLA